MTAATEIEEMTATVLLIGEWLLKQQQRLLEEKQSQIEAQQKQIEQLNEQLDKLKNRSSKNSSVPPASDQLKKPSDKSKRKKGKKRGPKYDHPGKTRNGFGQADEVKQLKLDGCPVSSGEVEPVEEAPEKVQQVAELVEQPVAIREYRRSMYRCLSCGWTGYSSMPWGIKEGFSYGGRLCSIVGWLGYGGNLTWRKQEYFIEQLVGLSVIENLLSQ
jgi:DNA-binding protein H-NS